MTDNNYKELFKLFSISSISDDYLRKFLLIQDFIQINTLIISLINKASTNGYELSQLGICDPAVDGLILPMKNIPATPVFRLKNELPLLMNLSEDESMYPFMLLKQFKLI